MSKHDVDYNPGSSKADKTEVWKQTSTWTTFQRELCKIRYKDCTEPEFFPSCDFNNINLLGDDADLLLPDYPSEGTIGLGAITQTSRTSRTFLGLLQQIVNINNDEDLVDNIVVFMLAALGFGEFGLHLRPKPLVEFMLNGKLISTEADFGVYIKRFGKHVYFLVDENKCHKASKPERGECQIAGELLGYACYNYRERNASYPIYCMRMYGREITFYCANFSIGYLQEIENGIPSTWVTVKKFPPDTNPLDIMNLVDRKRVLQYLIVIRDAIKSYIA